MSMNNFELYKVFYWAAKTGSLSQAAKVLFITQPSVSHAIKQLEDSFGLTLFNRNSKGVTLTPEEPHSTPTLSSRISSSPRRRRR